jgi:hypothetical protein
LTHVFIDERGGGVVDVGQIEIHELVEDGGSKIEDRGSKNAILYPPSSILGYSPPMISEWVSVAMTTDLESV